MKYIKLFENFGHEDYDPNKTHEPKVLGNYNNFTQFCREVSEWSKENSTKVLWDIITDKKHWDSYVKDGAEICLIEVPLEEKLVSETVEKKLVAILHKGEDILRCLDNDNKEMDTKKLLINNSSLESMLKRYIIHISKFRKPIKQDWSKMGNISAMGSI
jgi:hypothetical protein